ncbi:MAG: hypothetical protein ABJH52_04640 [Henriciella sp.]
MILRRLATAFRKQDWFTVAVETLIVVFGVFIGLQVNNWNEARQDRAVAAQFEVSLITDAEIILSDAQAKIAFMEDAFEAMTELRDLFSQKDVALDEAEIIERLTFALNLPSHPDRAPSIIEAVANRDLRLVRNEDLRLAILNWDRLLQASAVTQQARREYTRAYVEPIARLGALASIIPFAEALSDSGSRNDMLVALNSMRSLLGGELGAFRFVEQETEALLVLLKADAS